MAGERTLPGLGLRGFYTDGSNGWGTSLSEDLRKVSALSQLVVSSRTTDVAALGLDEIKIAPTDDPTNPNKIVVNDSGNVVYLTPKSGWVAYVVDEAANARFNGSAWVAVPSAKMLTLSTSSGAAYSVTNADLAGEVLREHSHTAAATITVPSGLTGTEPVSFAQSGAGALTFAAGGGVTIQSKGGKLATTGQWATATLIPKGSNVYLLAGDLG
jgi:hypothetical protein